MATPPRVGIVAPCSTVPAVEFAVGERFLREAGFDVKTHPQVSRQHFTFAGTDEDRAEAFYEYAADPNLDILWSARGGYGATRILRLLDDLTAKRGRPPRKLLIGYSDVTALHEYVHARWNWPTLHSPMPAAADFSRLKPSEWGNILKLARKEPVPYPATDRPLTPVANAIAKPVRAELIGGNLSLWAAMAGTKHSPTPAKGKFLFLEDVGEALYRIDRMTTQLENAGLLDGAAGLILGDFTDCNDDVSTCLAPCDSPEALSKALDDPKKAKRQPLRPTYTQDQGFEEIFTNLAKRLHIPLYRNLPVGHGPNFHPLPLHATYELSADHKLKLVDWDWAK